MFKKINWTPTFIAASIAAVAFCIPVFFYINMANYTETWLLYLGSFLFLVVMWFDTTYENKRRGENESMVTMVFATNVTTIVGIIFSCIICFIMLSVLVPNYLGAGNAEKVMVREPASSIDDKTNGLSFKVFMAATVINFCAGAFVGIILPFTAKRNQTKDNREPSPMHQRGVQ
jgi:amino acid transporter